MQDFKTINSYSIFRKYFQVQRYLEKLRSEDGSLSLLIIALFIAALSSMMIMTDVAVVANAKRSLDHATEAAAMRAVHNLDEKSYYSGKHTVLTSIRELASGGNYAENRVPIDCQKGREAVFDDFSSWFNSSSNLKTIQIKSYSIDSYQCEFDAVHLVTSARVKLPFPAPFTSNDEHVIKSSITTLNEKDKGLYLFGVRIH